MITELIIIVLLIILIYFSSEIHNLFNKLWINKYFIYTVIINKLFKSKASEDTIVFHDTHIHITYYLNQNPHTIRVPYNQKNKNKFHKMILIKDTSDGNVEIDITHKHGIPYLLTARELGGKHINKRVAGEDVSQFEIDEIPKI